ncbi:MAG TPA: DUF6230 family protein [Bacillales bacterium]
MDPLYMEEAVEEESELVTGRTVKKKLFAALLSGFLLLGGLAAAFGISGVAYAMPIAGVGDFYVEFDKLTGSGFKLFTKVGDTGKEESVPMIRVKIDKATVNGLHIYKEMELPGVGKVRFNITASEPVKIKGLIQDFQVQNSNAKFTNQTIDENFGAENPFSQTAKTLTLTDAKLKTDYLFQSVVTLNGLHLGFEKIGD